jgi:hypothetical protein
MMSAKSSKILCVEKIVAKARTETWSHQPCDVLSDDDEDGVVNEIYTDFEPQIARKVKKTVCHLSSDSEIKSADKQVGNNKSEIYTVGRGTVT